MVLLDTHTLLWWTFEPEKLSERALDECLRIEKEYGYISSISIWEIGIKIKKKKLEIPLDFEIYVDRIKQIENLNIIPITEGIWLKNLSLDWHHSDPADRTIVASAIIEGIPIISKDEKIKKFYKNTIW